MPSRPQPRRRPRLLLEVPPERAYAWELRLQDEIEPGFTVDEPGSDEARATFEQAHPDTVTELGDKETKRRERKQAKADKATDGQLFESN